MIQIQTIADLELLRESVDLECKLAVGRDGKGALPEDFWSTYSAFANAESGIVVLGVREKQGQFLVEGLVNVAKVRKELFDALNNRQKVSVNLLSDALVREIQIEGRTVMVVEIPRATRKQRPVHLTTNPFAGHTYQHLTQVGMLESTGGRGAVYHLPGEAIPTPDDVFGPPARISVLSSRI